MSGAERDMFDDGQDSGYSTPVSEHVSNKSEEPLINAFAHTEDELESQYSEDVD